MIRILLCIIITGIASNVYAGFAGLRGEPVAPDDGFHFRLPPDTIPMPFPAPTHATGILTTPPANAQVDATTNNNQPVRTITILEARDIANDIIENEIVFHPPEGTIAIEIRPPLQHIFQQGIQQLDEARGEIILALFTRAFEGTYQPNEFNTARERLNRMINEFIDDLLQYYQRRGRQREMLAQQPLLQRALRARLIAQREIGDIRYQMREAFQQLDDVDNFPL